MGDGGAGGGGGDDGYGGYGGPDESVGYGGAGFGGSSGIGAAPGVGAAEGGDIGDAISTADVAALAQAEEDAFGGLHTAQQATPDAPPEGFSPHAIAFQSPLGIGPDISYGRAAQQALTSVLGGLLGTSVMGVPGLVGGVMNALGATPGNDVDAYGSPIGDVGTNSVGGGAGVGGTPGGTVGGAQGPGGGAQNWNPQNGLLTGNYGDIYGVARPTGLLPY